MKVGALSDTHLLQLVPLSKLIKNVTRATALDEIEIFEANMAEGTTLIPRQELCFMATESVAASSSKGSAAHPPERQIVGIRRRESRA